MRNSLLLQLFCSMSAAFTLNFFRSGINFSKWGSFQLPGLLNFGEFKVKLSWNQIFFVCWLISCLTSYSSHGGFIDERIQPSNLDKFRKTFDVFDCILHNLLHYYSPFSIQRSAKLCWFSIATLKSNNQPASHREKQQTGIE